MLAEAAHATHVPPRWIAQPDWTQYELALFATESIEQEGAASRRFKYMLGIDFNNPDGWLAWAMKTIVVCLVQS